MIDIMGRGSILNYNNVLSGETCLYRAYAISSHSTVVLKISKERIEKIAATNKTLQKNLEQQKILYETYGLP